MIVTAGCTVTQILFSFTEVLTASEASLNQYSSIPIKLVAIE